MPQNDVEYANRYYVDNMHQNNDTRGSAGRLPRLTSERSDACVTRCNQRRRPRRTAARFFYPAILDAASRWPLAACSTRRTCSQMHKSRLRQVYKGSRGERLRATTGKASPRARPTCPKRAREVSSARNPRSGGGRVRVGYSVPRGRARTPGAAATSGSSSSNESPCTSVARCTGSITGAPGSRCRRCGCRCPYRPPTELLC